MFSCWQFSVVLFFLLVISRGSSITKYEIKFQFEDSNGSDNTEPPIKIDFGNEESITSLEYNNKKFINVKIVKVNAVLFNGKGGIKGKFKGIRDDKPKEYVTLLDKMNMVDVSKEIKDIEIKCNIEKCQSGLFIISEKKIESSNDINLEKVKAFFLLFQSENDIFYFKSLEFKEFNNFLVACPSISKWLPKSDYLEYKQHKTFKYYDKLKIDTSLPFYPAVQNTQSSYNSNEYTYMICGNIYHKLENFTSKEILTVGYQLKIEDNKNIKDVELEKMNTLGCKNIQVNDGGIVERKTDHFIYIPLSQTFNNISRIEYAKNWDSVSAFKSSSYCLVYHLNNPNLKPNSKIPPTCSYQISYKSLKKKYSVTLIKKGLGKKIIKNGNKTEEFKIFEIDISKENKNGIEELKKNVCKIGGINAEGLKDYGNKLDEYYSLQYKSVFFKLDYNNFTISLPRNLKFLESIDNSLKNNSFEMFGLYKCHSIDRFNKLTKTTNFGSTNFESFFVLPKKGKEKSEYFLESYKNDYVGKGKCDVNKQNFGFLESISVNKNSNIITLKISEIKNSSDFKYINRESEVIYKGDIEKDTKLYCKYKTKYDLHFTIAKYFGYKTNTSSRNVTDTVTNDTKKDSTYYIIPIVISVVVGVGIISISIIFAVVFLKKRKRKRRGNKKKKLKKKIDPTSLLDIKTTSDSSSMNSTKDKKANKSKVVKKVNTIDISSSESQSLQNNSGKIANNVKPREIIRFTTK